MTLLSYVKYLGPLKHACWGASLRFAVEDGLDLVSENNTRRNSHNRNRYTLHIDQIGVRKLLTNSEKNFGVQWRGAIAVSA